MRRDDKIFVTVWAIWALVCLAILGAVLVVAIHFIGKYW